MKVCSLPPVCSLPGFLNSFEELQAEECGILNGCENGRCVRVQEGYTCDCFDGYHLDMAKMTCVGKNHMYLMGTYPFPEMPCGWTSYSLLHWRFAAFQFGKKRKILEVDGGGNCLTVWRYIPPPDCPLKNGQNGQFYVLYILLWFLKKYLRIHINGTSGGNTRTFGVIRLWWSKK